VPQDGDEDKKLLLRGDVANCPRYLTAFSYHKNFESTALKHFLAELAII
jgi:hypothetical protein